MESWMRRGGALVIGMALIAALAGAALVGTAFAHKPRIPSTVSIHEYFDSTANEDVFHGRVGSEKRACKRHRTVLLKLEGHPGSSGSDTTNRRGHYEIRLLGDTISGDYYVKVRRKERENVICKAAESERLHLGP